MSLTVQNNVGAAASYRNMGVNKKEKEKEDEKLSSGYSINSAADDPARLAVSEKMRAQITISNASSDNASMAQNMVKVAEGAMQEVNDMLNRATELSTQASNGTYSQSDREALQMEVDQLVEQINTIASNTSFNGVPLLDGSLDTEFSLDGTSEGSISVSLEGVSPENNGITPTDMTIVTQADANAILEKLTSYVDSINEQRAELGATHNRLGHAKNTMDIYAENLQSAESRMRDTDIAKSATESNQKSLNYQAAASAFDKAEEDKETVLSILGS